MDERNRTTAGEAVWKEEMVPTEREMSVFVPIQTAAMWKLEELIEMDEMQFGFSKAKRTIDGIFALKQMQEKHFVK